MLLSVLNEVIDWAKGVNPSNVALFVAGWGSVLLTLTSVVGRIKSNLKINETNTKASVKEMRDETIAEVTSLKTELNVLKEELKFELNELKEREVETDAKLTRIMKKDPISKYKYGEVKEYAPQVTNYVAEKVVEEVKEEVEATHLVETTPLLKKKRKAKTSFVD